MALSSSIQSQWYRVQRQFLRSVIVVCALHVFGSDAMADEMRLFDDFKPEWRRQWKDQRFFSKPSVYSVVHEGEKPVLHAVSNAANSCLLREVVVDSPTRAQLSWRWKVSEPLNGNTAERERRGDDFAARVMVVFETSPLPLRTRAINYVWAAHEPAGAVYPNPYSSNVAMVVLRSGDAHARKWQAESRDVIADYQRFFGKSAGRISAVAVLADTDNTDRLAEAWFADLVLDFTAPGSARE